MKKQLSLLLLILFSLTGYSQIVFEKGYFIDNEGQKTDCLIKNIDWKDNPTEFIYKLSVKGVNKRATIASVQEFGIYNVSKYIRRTVMMDRSDDRLNHMSDVRKPIFNEEKLFLRALVEGEANLYVYEDGDLKRYFFNMNDTDVEQLVFKYYKKSDNEMRENNYYQQQLWNNLKCSGINLKKIERIKYKERDLTDFFVKYNECKNQKLTNYDDRQKRDLFNLTLRPGLNSSTLKLRNSSSPNYNTDFDNKLSLRIGIEAELILPYNKNKWALLFEPTYQSYKSVKNIIYIKTEHITRNMDVTTDYKSIELPVSIRYYTFLNDDSKLFFNFSFIPDLATQKSSITAERTNLNNFKIRPKNSVAFGTGYKFKNLLSLEIRYQPHRELLRNFIVWSTDYTTFSVILGYSLF